MDTGKQAPRACNVETGAMYLGISVNAVRGLIRSDKLPAKRYGRRLLVEYADLDALFEGLPEADRDDVPEAS